MTQAFKASGATTVEIRVLTGADLDRAWHSSHAALPHLTRIGHIYPARLESLIHAPGWRAEAEHYDPSTGNATRLLATGTGPTAAEALDDLRSQVEQQAAGTRQR